MNESAVMTDPTLEMPAVPSAAARPAERRIRVRKQKRFLAGVRFNGLRYLVLIGSLALAWGLLRGALWKGTGSPEATFMLALAGGLLAAAAKSAIDILSWADATRQLVHVERMHAVQRVCQRACTLREQAVLDWRRMHTVLVDHLTGQEQATRLFQDHDETDRQAEALFKKALAEEGWIRRSGVDAVRRFKKEIAAIDYDVLPTEADFLSVFNACLERLRRELALAAIGLPLD